jgi:hypothetical protein
VRGYPGLIMIISTPYLLTIHTFIGCRIDNVKGTVWERITDRLHGLPDPDWRDLERTFCAKVMQPIAAGSRTARRSASAVQLLDPVRARPSRALMPTSRTPAVGLRPPLAHRHAHSRSRCSYRF